MHAYAFTAPRLYTVARKPKPTTVPTPFRPRSETYLPRDSKDSGNFRCAYRNCLSIDETTKKRDTVRNYRDASTNPLRRGINSVSMRDRPIRFGKKLQFLPGMAFSLFREFFVRWFFRRSRTTRGVKRSETPAAASGEVISLFIRLTG